MSKTCLWKLPRDYQRLHSNLTERPFQLVCSKRMRVGAVVKQMEDDFDNVCFVSKDFRCFVVRLQSLVRRKYVVGARRRVMMS
jgi:hypothetical protein